jgi:hypothetical protein
VAIERDPPCIGPDDQPIEPAEGVRIGQVADRLEGAGACPAEDDAQPVVGRRYRGTIQTFRKRVGLP